MFVSAFIFRDIINLRGGSILKSMKKFTFLTANAKTNITHPLVSNLPLSRPLCECIYTQPLAAKLRILLTAYTLFIQIIP
jgi:hypothetical protein